MEDKKENWENYLDCCIFSYNTSKHESSKLTPVQVMHGLLPVDLKHHEAMAIYVRVCVCGRGFLDCF